MQAVVEPWETLESRGANTYVHVDRDILDVLAHENPELTIPDWRFPGIHPENDWAFATQTVVSSVINFHFLNRNRRLVGESWSMRDPRNGTQLSGSNALHPRMTERFGEAEDITAKQIRQLSFMYEFDGLLPRIPMEYERRELLKEFAYGLDSNYSGSVRELLEATRDESGDLRMFNAGEGLVERLTDKQVFGRAFLDTSYLGDLVFPFNKRAGLAPVLIHGRATTSDTLPTFGDIDQAGTITDYRLPQAFRAMGAITYNNELAHMVDSYEPIKKDSQEEIEIRGATAFSTAYLLAALNERRAELGQDPRNIAHLDFWLWKMGRELKKNGDDSLPHYTRTTAY